MLLVLDIEDMAFLKGSDLLTVCHVWKSDVSTCCHVSVLFLLVLTESHQVTVNYAFNHMCKTEHDSVITKLCSSELFKVEVF